MIFLALFSSPLKRRAYHITLGFPFFRHYFSAFEMLSAPFARCAERGFLFIFIIAFLPLLSAPIFCLSDASFVFFFFSKVLVARSFPIDARYAFKMICRLSFYAAHECRKDIIVIFWFSDEERQKALSYIRCRRLFADGFSSDYWLSFIHYYITLMPCAFLYWLPFHAAYFLLLFSKYGNAFSHYYFLFMPYACHFSLAIIVRIRCARGDFSFSF